MPLFVHLTPERNVRSITRVGLRGTRGVFCLPVLPDYGRTHQWLRELKRSGQRTIVAIDFRLQATERVLVGRYNQPHLETTAAAAVRAILATENSLGYEVVVPHAIGPRAIHSVRRLSQVIGWRYSPTAKGRIPCGCPACLGRGEIKGRKLRQRYLSAEWYYKYQVMPYSDALAELRTLTDPARQMPEDDKSRDTACDILHQIGYWKAGVPGDLVFLLGHPCPEIVEAVARALAAYSSRQVRTMLLELCRHPSEEVRAAAAESMLDSAGSMAHSLLAPFTGDVEIARVLAKSGNA